MIRTVKRQIAKARLAAVGVDRINRRMKTPIDGEPTWRKILHDDGAHNAQAKGKKAKRIRKDGTIA